MNLIFVTVATEIFKNTHNFVYYFLVFISSFYDSGDFGLCKSLTSEFLILEKCNQLGYFFMIEQNKYSKLNIL